MKKILVLITASILLLATVVSAKNTQSDELNQISGIICDNSDYSSWGRLNFSAGAYIDNYGNYVHLQFNGTKELIVKIFERKSFITSYGGFADDCRLRLYFRQVFALYFV